MAISIPPFIVWLMFSRLIDFSDMKRVEKRKAQKPALKPDIRLADWSGEFDRANLVMGRHLSPQDWLLAFAESHFLSLFFSKMANAFYFTINCPSVRVFLSVCPFVSQLSVILSDNLCVSTMIWLFVFLSACLFPRLCVCVSGSLDLLCVSLSVYLFQMVWLCCLWAPRAWTRLNGDDATKSSLRKISV